ncbi:MAG: patatin-like phospholipase family protein [Anaerolineae bacterium]|nr:patatin-like phospholipase family protein [Anaerolineae bacterium]MDQ7034257.1 patatin-like phospholipase family protein [Anaerolineae bacterium]
MSKTLKILAIDGGGIRGILPSIILSEIERRTGQRTAYLFDLIAGSSTGGLLTMGLNVLDEQGQPCFTAEEMALMYERDGPTIFSRSMWRSVRVMNNINGSKYPSDGIDSVLDHYFGDKMLSEAVGNVLITSYEIKRRQPWFFRSRKARTSIGCDFSMHDVVRATTAAPTFFEPAQVFHPDLPDDHYALIDGSLNSANPALCAYVEAKDKNPDVEDYLIVSLGTGDHTRELGYEEAKQWGLAGWSQHIMSIAFHAMSGVVDYQLRHLLPACRDGIQRYYRFQTRLTDGASDDLDDTSSKNIAALKALADKMIADNDDMLDQIAEQLLL